MHVATEQEMLIEDSAELDEFLACADDEEVSDYLQKHLGYDPFSKE